MCRGFEYHALHRAPAPSLGVSGGFCLTARRCASQNTSLTANVDRFPSNLDRSDFLGGNVGLRRYRIEGFRNDARFGSWFPFLHRQKVRLSPEPDGEDERNFEFIATAVLILLLVRVNRSRLLFAPLI